MKATKSTQLVQRAAAGVVVVVVVVIIFVARWSQNQQSIILNVWTRARHKLIQMSQYRSAPPPSSSSGLGYGLGESQLRLQTKKRSAINNRIIIIIIIAAAKTNAGMGANVDLSNGRSFGCLFLSGMEPFRIFKLHIDPQLWCHDKLPKW